jgi:tRNA pseudouridine38-40 synthase
MGSLVLTVSYDGTEFAGSQAQPGARTVQGEIEAALSRLFGEVERTTFAGRTDRGVHAVGQVVACRDRRPDLPVRTIRAAMNAALPSDLAVLAVDRRPASFHPRFDARWREYRYRIWSGIRQPLAERAAWRRAEDLAAGAMDGAARRLVGTRDVASLAGGGEGVPWSVRQEHPRGTVRTILVCGCAEVRPWWGPVPPIAGRLIEVRLAADGFLPRMVRNTVAALVEVGAGRRPAEWIDELLAAGDRRAGVGTAPARGLTLWRVGYDDEEPDGSGWE